MAASLTVDLNGQKMNSAYPARSPKYMTATSSSEDLETNGSSTESGQRSQCLCSPTTHEGSFRCRLHRSSSGYWGKRPMPSPMSTPTPKPMSNGVVNGTEHSVESQSNIADAFCTCGTSTPTPTPTSKPMSNGVVKGTEHSVESQSNIADAFCTSGLTSDNPSYGEKFKGVVSSR